MFDRRGRTTITEKFLGLLPEEREALDTFAFAQSLLEKGGDVERRFALISLDNSVEIKLRAYLLKRGVDRETVDGIRKLDDLLWRCMRAGLKLEDESRTYLYEMHHRRNQIYHGKMIMLPTKHDLEAWSKLVGSLLLQNHNHRDIEENRIRSQT